MVEDIICKICNSPSSVSTFEAGRNHCNSCRTHQNEVSVSKTYKTYLARLHTNSKSKVATHKRTKEHAFTITREDLYNLWEKQDGRCAISGVFLTHHRDGSGAKDYNASIDRISNVKSYTPENVQLVTYRINLMKHALSEDMFYWWIKTIHDFSCD